ncbi:MAG TPA: hypothetical protein VL093_03670 [Flavipsychrobacter sp.]|nr:hypothetical protein [Flavipsychrobacter sp.]
MKKIALAAALVFGITISAFAQTEALPRYAQPKSPEDKVVVDKAVAETKEMTKTLNLSADEASVALEVNVSTARVIDRIRHSDDPKKEEAIQKVEEQRLKTLERHMTAQKFHKYTTNRNKEQ